MNVRRKRNHSRQRGLHIVLAAALCINLLAGPVLATTEDRDGPIAPSQAQPGDRPVITLQGNAVTEYGKPTGFFELAVNVKTPDKASSERAKTFRSVDLTLMFDPTILTPVTWDTDTPIDLAGTTGYSVQLDTKKADNISSAYAVTDESGKLVFSAKTLRDVSFPEETTIAVLRFQYDLETYALLQDDPDAAHFVYPNPEQWKSPDAHWPAAPGGTPQPKRSLVWFAPDADAAEGLAGQSIWYESGQTEFYYCTALNGDGTPDTAGKIVTAYGSADPVGSTTTNLLTAGTKADETDIRFEFINYDSYVNKGVDLGNLSTILFYDWDDTLIGVLTVPKHVDVRDRVNEYVEANMVHPQLRGDAAKAAVGSTARADSYRGKYPYSGPNGNTDEIFGDDAGVNSDGASLVGGDYPLTNKLDYTFFKREMKYVKADDPAVELDPAADQTGKWVQAADDTTGKGLYDAEFPYVNGWARCPSAQTVEDTWTTLGGTGELSDYAVDAANQTASFTVADNMAFNIVDFEQGLTDATVYVKALYEPGDLLEKGEFYKTSKAPAYERFGTMSTELGGVYSMTFQYERVSKNGYGVNRARNLAFVLQYTIDLDGREGKDFFMESIPQNKDIVDVSLSPSSAITAVDYYLTDKYGGNFVVGSQRSSSLNELGIPTNFNYSLFSYKNRLGSDGFVHRATLNAVLKAATAVAEANAAGDTILAESLKKTYQNMLSMGTATDLNFKYDLAGTEFTTMTFEVCQIRVLDAVERTYALGQLAGNQVELSWHDLQYHILQIDGGLFGPDGSIKDESTIMASKFAWCRLDDGCVSGAVVEDWASLITAARSYQTDSAALNSLSLSMGTDEPFYLKEDVDGTSFAELETLKTKLSDAVLLADSLFGEKTHSWDVIQHLILHPEDAGSSELQMEIKGAAAYWWYNGGRKVTDWDSLLEAADTANQGRSAQLNTLTGNGIGTVSDPYYYLRKDLSGGEFMKPDIDPAMNEFKSALQTAVAVTGVGASWDVVQYQIIHKGDTPPTEAVAQAESENRYFWKGGAVGVTDFDSLMAAVVLDVTGQNKAALASLTDMSIVDSSIHLRADFKGTKFSEVEELKNALRTVVRMSSESLNWSQVQYALVHINDDNHDLIIAPEIAEIESSNFYWWRNGAAHGNAVSQNTTVPSVLTTLIEAAYRAEINGNSNAWAFVDEQIAKEFLLIGSYAGTEADLTALHYFENGEIDKFKAAMQAFVRYGMEKETGWNKYSIPVSATLRPTWYQVQHFILSYIVDPNNPEYLLKTDGLLPDKNTYWWLTRADNPNVQSLTDIQKLLQDMAKAAMDVYSKDEFKATIDINRMSLLALKRNSKGQSFSAGTIATAQENLYLLAKAAYPTYYDSSTGLMTLSWSNLQFGILNSGAIGTGSYKWDPKIDTYAMSLQNEGLINRTTLDKANKTIEVSPDGSRVTTICQEEKIDPQTGDLIVIASVEVTVTVSTVAGNQIVTTIMTSTTVTATVIDGVTGESVVSVESTSNTETIIEQLDPTELPQQEKELESPPEETVPETENGVGGEDKMEETNQVPPDGEPDSGTADGSEQDGQGELTEVPTVPAEPDPPVGGSQETGNGETASMRRPEGDTKADIGRLPAIGKYIQSVDMVRTRAMAKHNWRLNLQITDDSISRFAENQRINTRLHSVGPRIFGPPGSPADLFADPEPRLILGGNFA